MILCRIGLHSWKPVFKPNWFTWPSGCRVAFSGPGWLDFGWENVARKCRHCGKRAMIRANPRN